MSRVIKLIEKGSDQPIYAILCCVDIFDTMNVVVKDEDYNHFSINARSGKMCVPPCEQRVGYNTLSDKLTILPSDLPYLQQFRITELENPDRNW